MPRENTPRVSVCVLAYNHAPFIEQALRSVFEQDAAYPIEIVVLDDCSTDGTREKAHDLLRSSGAPHRLITRIRNLGVGASFSELLRSARGEYVAFLEGDDYWSSPNKLTEQVELLDSLPELAGCYGDAKVVDASDRVLGEYFPHHGLSRPTVDIDQRAAVTRGVSGPACTYMFRRGAIEPLPRWFLPVASHQAIMVVLTAHGLVRFIDRDWGHYRVHSGGVWSSATSARRIAHDWRFVAAMLRDPVLARRYGDTLAARLALTTVSLARAKASEIIAALPRRTAWNKS